jgi:hypothetical protein
MCSGRGATITGALSADGLDDCAVGMKDPEGKQCGWRHGQPAPTLPAPGRPARRTASEPARSSLDSQGSATVGPGKEAYEASWAGS